MWYATPMPPTTPTAYLAALPPDRRQAIAAVRQVILDSLDSDYEEGIQYGMLGYYVPHRVYPSGYHCDPKQPLPFIGLGSSKAYMSLHMMCLYMNPEHSAWFQAAWAKTGKKLNMGKACIRFKKAEDLALEVIGEAIRRVPAAKYIATIESALASRKPATKVSAKLAKKTAKQAGKQAGKKAAKKATPKKAPSKKAARNAPGKRAAAR